MKRTVLVGVSMLALALSSVLAGGALAAHSGQKVETIHFTIVPGGKKGPDGKMHDAYIGRTSFTARVGEKVVVIVKNTDSGVHTFTAPGLKLNEVILGNKTTTFTFTPTKKGSFEWHCDVKCDDAGGYFSMHPATRNGFMGGVITVS